MNKAIVNKILVVVLHACGWALLFSLPYRFLGRGNVFFEKGSERLPPPQAFNQAIPFDPAIMKVEALLTNSLSFLFFYTNMFILVPKVLAKKGWTLYSL